MMVKCPLARRREGRLASEEKREGNGNRKRRHDMLALAIILPVVLLVVIPGFLIIFGLSRAAGKEVPRPGDTAPICRPAREREIAVQSQLFRTPDGVRRRLARADYN